VVHGLERLRREGLNSVVPSVPCGIARAQEQHRDVRRRALEFNCFDFYLIISSGPAGTCQLRVINLSERDIRCEWTRAGQRDKRLRKNPGNWRYEDRLWFSVRLEITGLSGCGA
jgi:hypothetical protein